MDHVGINAASPQPTGQPKTIPSGLIRDRNPRDLLPRLDGLVTPTIQKLQQLFRIRRNLLQRFAIDARDHAGDEPYRCPTNRDFLPCRLSDAGLKNAWIVSAIRRP